MGKGLGVWDNSEFKTTVMLSYLGQHDIHQGSNKAYCWDQRLLQLLLTSLLLMPALVIATHNTKRQ